MTGSCGGRAPASCSTAATNELTGTREVAVAEERSASDETPPELCTTEPLLRLGLDALDAAVTSPPRRASFVAPGGAPLRLGGLDALCRLRARCVGRISVRDRTNNVNYIAVAMWETFCYVCFGGVVTAVLLSAASIPFGVMIPFVGRLQVVRAYGRFTAFVCLLTAFGLFGHLFFALVLRDSWYIAADPLVDFLPYLPSVSLAVDEVCGGRLLAGVTPTKFRLAWLGVAFPIWLSAVATYRALVCGNRPSH